LNPEIPSELALSEEQRAAVAVRLDELGLAEIACDVDHTMAVVVDLLDAFPTAKLSPDQVRSKAKGYIIALEDTPIWAVFEAARRWLQARAGAQNYDFAPVPPRLRAVADDVLREVRGQRCTLQRLLRARVAVVTHATEEERAHLGKVLTELPAMIRARQNAERAAMIERHYQMTGVARPVGIAATAALAKALAEKDRLDASLEGSPAERAADRG
jgi:hypothetical protein